MPNRENFTEAPRRVLTVFYVLDVSGSMDGQPIATLNMAMGETIEAVKDAAKKNADAKVKVAVLTFSSGCQWITSNGPEELDEDFYWTNVTAGGLTDMGAALNELDNKLSSKAFLNEITGNYMPVIIFMSDGYPTDNYEKELAIIRNNKWFRRATKIGFAIGDAPDVQMMCNIVGNSEAVIKTSDLKLFARLLKFASVTASVLAAQSHPVEAKTSGADVIKSFTEATGEAIPTAEGTAEPAAEDTDTGSDPDWDDDGVW